VRDHKLAAGCRGATGKPVRPIGHQDQIYSTTGIFSMFGILQGRIRATITPAQPILSDKTWLEFFDTRGGYFELPRNIIT
jgi:hypothetical protein